MKLVAFPGGDSQKVELLSGIQHGVASEDRIATRARTLNETDCERYGISYDLLQLILVKDCRKNYRAAEDAPNPIEDLVNTIPVGADTSKIRYNLILLLWSRLTGKNPIVPYDGFKEYIQALRYGSSQLIYDDIKASIETTKQHLTSFQEFEHCLNLISKPLYDLRQFLKSTDLDQYAKQHLTSFQEFEHYNFDIPMAKLRTLLPTFYAINDKELHTALMIMNAALSPSSRMAFQLRNHFTGLDLLEIIKGLL